MVVLVILPSQYFATDTNPADVQLVTGYMGTELDKPLVNGAKYVLRCVCYSVSVQLFAVAHHNTL